MPWFRDPSAPEEAFARHEPDPLARARRIIAGALLPTHFFVHPPVALEWQYQPSEEVAWELFRGHLLDAKQTRQTKRFESWNVYWTEDGQKSEEPLLSVKLDAEAGLAHVTRAIHCHAWEGYDAGGNVYLSRPTRKWVRELVGTVDLSRFPDPRLLHDELIALLFRAVVGLSRLPLSSVEAPLPAYTLGRLGYCYRPALTPDEAGAGPLSSSRDLVQKALDPDVSRVEQAKLLELVLRATPTAELPATADLLAQRWSQLGWTSGDLAALFRTVFNEVALSPYTEFVDHCLAFWRRWSDTCFFTTEQFVDFLAYLLRQGARHLTAYDLVTFHHRGANYPDALLLDAVLRRLPGLIEARPQLFLPAADDPAEGQTRKRLRRRALRQGWLLWHTYRGLPVPEVPTSPGENARVLPSPYPHVDEEQILQPGRRPRRLYLVDDLAATLGPAAAEVLRQSVADLDHPEELRELGMALFLDRPLGRAKPLGEPDHTPLFSYEAFSRAVAEKRLDQPTNVPGLPPESHSLQRHREALFQGLTVPGLRPPPISGDNRPGTVSLADLERAGGDFVLLRSTRQTVRALLDLFDFGALNGRVALTYLAPDRRALVVGEPGGVLAVYDEKCRKRLELRIEAEQGYRSRAGIEYPAGGLRALRAWESGQEGRVVEQDLRLDNLILQPREPGLRKDGTGPAGGS